MAATGRACAGDPRRNSNPDRGGRAMKALARAVINAAAFLELSDDSALDPELALQALEEIALHLSASTPEERKVLTEVLAEMRANELETGPRPEVLAFL